MAEDDQSQEKTEEATPRRLEKAREDGQAPRSKELTTTAVLLGGSLGLLWFGGYLFQQMANLTIFNFTFSREVAFDTALMFKYLGHSISTAFFGLIPLFSILLLAALLGPVALGGLLFSAKSMAPKLSRMNPIEGIKRMFSLKALMELGKALAKVILILNIAIFLLEGLRDDILGLAYEDIHSAMAHSVRLGAWAAVALSLVTILIAAIDVPFQIWDNAKKLKMSVQDVKDEMKDTEGKPEVKGRIRQLQQEIANRKMMAAVPEADVVITNPTHYSVAVQYQPDAMETPIVVAKGVDRAALKIREIAGAHQVEIVQSPILARSIYHRTNIGDDIPEGLYLAVAKILAYVFQLRHFRQGLAKRPTFPYNVDVPNDMRYD